MTRLQRPGARARSQSPSAEHGPFTVSVAALLRAPGTRRRVQASGPLPDLDVTGSAVPAGADAAIDATLEAVSGGVTVTGTVTAPWTGACRRCLGPAGGVLQVAVRELFRRGGDGEDAYPLTGDTVDLAPVVHDAVLLELPPAPLCSPTCRGLCPECGANLNTEPCGGHVRRDERWAVLDTLRGDADGG